MKKRLLALLMVLALLATCIPGGALAEGTQQESQTPVAETQEATVEETTEVTELPKEHGHRDQHHDCDHCDGTVEWIAWGDDAAELTTAPTGTGHYYLVADITVSATADINQSADFVLCLNGYNIDAQHKTYIYRVGTNNSTTDKTKVTVYDCTAYTDAEGVYHAGALMNGKGKDGGGAFFLRGASSLSMYGGKLTGHQNTQTATDAGWGGGAIHARNSAQIYLENVEISNCSTQKDGGAICARNSVKLTLKNVTFKDNAASRDGGAIFLTSINNVLNATGCTFDSNTATTSGGAVCVASGNAELTDCQLKGNHATDGGAVLLTGEDSSVTASGCTFEENTSGKRGGAICALETSEVTVKGGKFHKNTAGSLGSAIYTIRSNATVTGTAGEYVQFTENVATADGGGTVYSTGTSDIRLQYVQMTKNVAKGNGGSAIMVTGNAHMTLADATITDNVLEVAGAFRGAVYVTGRISTLKLSGKVIIENNQQADLYVQNNNYNRDNDDCWITVDGLTEGSSVQLCTHTSVAKDEARLNNRILEGQPENWTKGWMVYQANSMAIDYDKENDKFFFTVNTNHLHCDCGDGTDANCDHTENAYLPWTDANSLPASGTYYLETDVVLPESVRVEGDLKLCLNGHNVTVEYAEQGSTRDRFFTMNEDDTLTLSDCTAKLENGVYTAGKLTGSSYAAVMVANSSTSDNTVVINFYDGIFTDNVSSIGAAFTIQDGATLNMYGGEISGNHATGRGGAIYAGTNGTVCIYGGTITGNTSDGNGTVYVGNSTLRLYGGTITGNTAAAGGGIYVTNSPVTMGGTPVVLDNTAGGNTSNFFVGGTAEITFDGMGEGTGQIGLSADTAPRYISADLGDEDCLSYFVTDSRYRQLEIKDNKLYLTFVSDHSHCDCGGGDSHCDHTKNAWMPWESATSLPTGDGYYYLLSDVTVNSAAELNAGHVHLCLNGHTVTAEGPENTNYDRFFTLQKDGKLTISDCTAKVENGVYTAGKLTGASGAAIMIRNQTGKDENGEELYNNSVLNLYDGIITGNSVSATNGVIAVQDRAVFNMYGGRICDNRSIAQIDENGTATGGYGGALYLGSNAVFNMYDGRICDNVSDTGAAVYVAGSTVNMYGGAISDNTTPNTAAGILLTGASTVMTVEGGEISGNTTTKAAGGVLIQTKATLHLKGGKISGNKGLNGAGVYVSYTGNLIMDGGEISGNVATGSGGGVYLLGSTAQLNGGKISSNTSKNYGGGVCATYYVRKATETREEQIYTTEINLAGVSISNNTTQGTGAGIMTSKSTVINMTAGSVTGNSTEKAAGGILLQSKSVLNLKGGTIAYNSAKNGAGVYVSTDSDINMYGGSITNNTSTGHGAGMYLLQADAVLGGGSISNNTTKSTGGGFYAAGSQVKLCGTNITDNTAEANGGGICTSKRTNKGVDYYTNITMTGGKVSGNETGGSGGGFLLQSFTTLTLKDGIIENNHTVRDGAGVYVSTNCTFHMEGGQIRNNNADRNGAGVCHYKSTANYTGGQITGNVAGGNGGGVLMTGQGYVVNMGEGIVITDNTATNGGAIVVQGKITLNMENVDLNDNRATTGNGGAIYVSTNTFLNIKGGSITNHSCDGYGGAIFSTTNSTLNIDGLVMKNNKAGYGGAMSLGGTVNLTNSTVAENESVNEGGGIFCHKVMVGGLYEDHLITLRDSVVENNKAGTQGGGIYVRRGSECLFDGVTVQNNTAVGEGGGLYVIDDTFMYNMTVTGNTSGGEGYALYLADSEFDGESYFIGIFKLGGEMKVYDNAGGDMYFGHKTAAAVDHMGLTGDTKINVKLHSGLLTQVLQGAYNYEGGNLEYVITAGDRSLTNPEYDPTWNDQFNPEEPTQAPTEGEPVDRTEQEGTNPIVWVIAAAGAVVVAAVIAILAVLGKKKKAVAGK